MLLSFLKMMMPSRLIDRRSDLEKYLADRDPKNEKDLDYYVKQYDRKNNYRNAWWTL